MRFSINCRHLRRGSQQVDKNGTSMTKKCANPCHWWLATFLWNYGNHIQDYTSHDPYYHNRLYRFILSIFHFVLSAPRLGWTACSHTLCVYFVSPSAIFCRPLPRSTRLYSSVCIDIPFVFGGCSLCCSQFSWHFSVSLEVLYLKLTP